MREPTKNQKFMAAPEGVFQRARSDATLHAILQEWKLGGLTWEQCLCKMVCTLHDGYHQVMGEHIALLHRQPPKVTVSCSTCEQCGETVLASDLQEVTLLCRTKKLCPKCRT